MPRWSKRLLIPSLLGIFLTVCHAAPVVPKPDPREEKLLRERRDYLRNVLVQRQDSFKAGRVTAEVVLDAHRALFLAELELTPKPADRATLCDDFARQVARGQDAIEGAYKAGRLTELEYARGIAGCREDELLILRQKSARGADRDAAARIPDMLRSRRDAWQTALQKVQAELDAGRRSPGAEELGLLNATLRARLEDAEKPEERLRILQQQLDRLTRIKEIVDIQFDAGRVTPADPLQARGALLAVQIALAREKPAGDTPPEKLAAWRDEQRKAGQELVEVRYRQYDAGRLAFTVLLTTLEERLRTELAAADKADERIALLKASLAEVKKIEEAAKIRMESSFIPQADYETICAVRLEAQVRLLRAERDRK
jgi:hypothetical protein